MQLRAPMLFALLAAGCAGDPKALNGTALYVTNFFDADYKVRQLLFIGDTTGGNDAFPRGARPDPASTTDLNGPLTARILLSDSLAGKEVALTVYALDLNGEVVEVGYATTPVALGVETDVEVQLTPFVSAPSDGGVVDAGFDAGIIDAGTRTDGGTGCDCATGCCIFGANPDGGPCAPSVSTTSTPGNEGTIAPLTITAQFCGRANNACTGSDFCDPLRANACAGPKCVCGTMAAQCPQGTRCSVSANGAASCVCDRLSNCDGCCSPQGTCEAPAPNTCGAGGIACQKCLGATGFTPGCENPVFGAGACSNSTTCPGCNKVNECCSGNACSGFGGFPTCRARPAGMVSSVCESCDILRSNGCHWSTGQCACGDGGTCSPAQVCEKGACKSIF